MLFSNFKKNISSIYFLFLIFKLQIVGYKDKIQTINSLVATLPSDGPPMPPKVHYDDVLNLGAQGPIGVDPVEILNTTAEGLKFENYKMPFYYPNDPSPEDDGTHDRRRRDVIESEPSDVTDSEPGLFHRSRRFILNAIGFVIDRYTGEFLNFIQSLSLTLFSFPIN